MKKGDRLLLSRRADEPERMDSPDCDEDTLLRTIDQFDSINQLVSRYRPILTRYVLADMLQEPERDWHLLDMGAGGCDIDVWLLAEARQRGLSLRITACDVDARIVRHTQAKRGQVPGLTICRLDVLQDDVPEPVDYVFGNHFLHHLTNQEIVELLRRWGPRVRRRMIFSDLARKRISYAGFNLLSLFYRDSFAREDGLLSIRKGFRVSELYELACAAGIPEPALTVRTWFPGRLTLLVPAAPDAD